MTTTEYEVEISHNESGELINHGVRNARTSSDACKKLVEDTDLSAYNPENLIVSAYEQGTPPEDKDIFSVYYDIIL